MLYKLGIKENAIDSFNESLAKYREGEAGQVRSYKFAILHMAHFLELLLKMYVQTLDENLVYVDNFRLLEKAAATAKNKCILGHLKALKELGHSYYNPVHKAGNGLPKTIIVENALSLAKAEKCGVTGQLFIDKEFIDDINWLKSLRNNIEHYQFQIEPKDVRLCLGRIVRRADEFADVFSLFELSSEVGKVNSDLFYELANEYEHQLREAKLEVKEKEYEAFKGVRHKFYGEVDWNIYECPECNEKTLIPEKDSSTGYRCANCNNEESDEIEIPCDCCGSPSAMEEMAQWDTEEGGLEWRCYFCSGQYSLDRDVS